MQNKIILGYSECVPDCCSLIPSGLSGQYEQWGLQLLVARTTLFLKEQEPFMFHFLQAIWDEVMFTDQSKWHQNSSKAKKKSRTSDRIGVWTVWFILSNDSLPANQLLLLTSIINRQWLCFWHRDWSTKENYFWKILFLYICQKEIKNSIKSLLFLLILYEWNLNCEEVCE